MVRCEICLCTGCRRHRPATGPALEEAELKTSLAAVSDEVIAVVDHTKLGHPGRARCLPISRIDLLVTDLDPSDKRLDPYLKSVKLL